MGEKRPYLSKVGNCVFTTMPLLPRVCLSVIGQNRSHDPKVSQCRIKDVQGSGSIFLQLFASPKNRSSVISLQIMVQCFHIFQLCSLVRWQLDIMRTSKMG